MSQPPTPPTPPEPRETAGPGADDRAPADEFDEDTTPRHQVPRPPDPAPAPSSAPAPEPPAPPASPAPGAAAPVDTPPSAAEPRWAPAPAPGFTPPVPPGAVGTAPPPPGAAAPVPTGAAPTVLGGPQIWNAVARAGVGYGVLVAVSFVLCLLTLLVAALAGDDSSSSTWQSDAQDVSGGASVLTLPFVLAGAALLGPLRLSGGSGFGSTEISVAIVPLGLTLVLVAATWAWSLVRPTRATSVRAAWLAALTTGATLAVAAGLLSWIFHVSVTDSSGYGRLTADPLLAALGGLLLGTVAAALGEATVRDGRRLRVDLRALGIPLPTALSRAVVAAGVGYGAATLLVAAGFFVWFATTDDGGLGAAVLTTAYLGVNIGLLGMGLGGLGGLTAAGEASFDGAGGSSTFTLFSDDAPAALWLLLLAVVVGTLVAAVALVRTGVAARRWQDAWATPAVLAAATLVVTLVSGVKLTASVSVSSLGDSAGSGHVRLAAWTFLVAAVWGGVTEVLARTVVAAVVPAPRARAAAGAAVLTSAAVGPVTGTGADGLPAAGVADGPEVTPDAQRPVMSRGAALAVLGGLGGLVVLVAAGLVGWHLLGASHGPERQVEAYLDALSEGKPSEAFTVADPDVPDDQRALLTDDVYGAVKDRPSDVEIIDVEVHGDRAAVTARYDLGGEKATETYTLRKDGHESVVFDHWVMDPPELPTLPLGSLPDGTTAVVVEGQEVAVDSTSPELAVLPGTWEVTLPDQGPYLEASTVTYPVGASSTWELSLGSDPLEYTLTDAALQEAEKQSKDALAACLATNEPEPDGCEIQDWSLWEDDATRTRWTLDTPPTYTATDAGYDQTIRVEVSGGEATFTYWLPKSKDHYRDKAEHHADKEDVDYVEYYRVVDGKVVLDDRY